MGFLFFQHISRLVNKAFLTKGLNLLIVHGTKISDMSAWCVLAVSRAPFLIALYSEQCTGLDSYGALSTRLCPQCILVYISVGSNKNLIKHKRKCSDFAGNEPSTDALPESAGPEQATSTVLSFAKIWSSWLDV